MRRAVFILLLCGLLPGMALAQEYPTRNVIMVVPFAAGGPVDAMARLIGPKMAEGLGQPVVIENRAGASGFLGMGSVAHAAPDGYTILYSPISIAIAPALYRKLSFDAEKDLVPVSQIVSTTLVLAANPKANVQTVKDLVARAKAEPGKLNFGSSGVADPLQLGMEMLKTMTGTDMLPIPYKGQGPMFQALLAGEVDVAIVSMQSALSQFKNGRLKPLAITAAKRSRALPDLPTMEENGLAGYDLTSWHGLFAPAGTPREIIARLQREAARAVQTAEVKQRVESTGNEVVGSTPSEFDAKYRADIARFKQIVKDAKLPFQD
ncbi:MAG TPA: tripartite tricarboxylate transporter substrate binding protein [Burkholderiales bacterium]|jgi:tripartite-type tricarboxylate transporter receptor subunit TctC|nr:tripartite tricarboxylate transporter substrate binding protein [Burkholderiales bacterium]HEX2651305.1 tripartite tricarboxylate transporter substrate binding protein [Burkholderiales bacterium]